MNADRIQRLIILDSGLRAERGHHANFTRLLVREARSRGWATAVYSHREVSPHLRSEFQPVAHFATSPYDLPHEDAQSPVCADIANYVAQNEAFETDLDALQLGADGRDLILIPTITQNQLLGFANWLASPAAPKEVHVAVMLLFSPGWEVLRTGEELARAMYRHAFQVLAKVPVERLTLLAETQPVADEYRSLADRDVHVVPWPTAEPGMARLRTRARDHESLTIGYLGYAKAERGIHLLPQVIEQVLPLAPHARFFVQVDTFLPETVQTEVDVLQVLGERVTVHRGSIPREQFLSTLAGTDLVMMPYDPVAYRRRGSALFSEAAMLGKPMVVPAETWMAEQMQSRSLGGLCFDAFDAKTIAHTLLGAIANFDALQSAAESAAPNWTRERTAEAFLDALTQSASKELRQTAAIS